MQNLGSDRRRNNVAISEGSILFSPCLIHPNNEIAPPFGLSVGLPQIRPHGAINLALLRRLQERLNPQARFLLGAGFFYHDDTSQMIRYMAIRCLRRYADVRHSSSSQYEPSSYSRTPPTEFPSPISHSSMESITNPLLSGRSSPLTRSSTGQSVSIRSPVRLRSASNVPLTSTNTTLTGERQAQSLCKTICLH